jgi:alkylation response protein AidB-like acyl-CoA dehydrogenase
VSAPAYCAASSYEELKAKAIEAGLYAANMPEEVGGAGLDTLTWVLYEKELAAPTTRCTGTASHGHRTS